MARKVLILRKRRTTRQHVRDTFGRFSTESTKGVIRTINAQYLYRNVQFSKASLNGVLFS